MASPSARPDLTTRLDDERARAARAPGTDGKPRHYRRPAERPYTRAERESTTILFGGLTRRHEQLLQAALTGRGHRSEILPCPDVRAYQIGKELGNPGQCNPTHFTVGNLLAHLHDRQAAGASRREILDRYVLVTVGACGPCRFGMYEAEYRLALRNAGFEGFRVVLFDKDSGLDQSVGGAGIEFDVDLLLSILYAVVLGDLFNDIAFQVRPFEVVPGRTDEVLADGLAHVMNAFTDPAPPTPMRSALERAAGSGRAGVRQAAAIAERLLGRAHVDALADVADALSRVEVDRTRLRPVVKVTGEFWAQTTEGDGNFRMFSFLEREGAQVMVEPVATWMTYLLHQSKQRNADRKGVTAQRAVRAERDLLGRALDEARLRRANAPLSLAERTLRREWDRHRRALGSLPHPLADQYELQRLAHPYYNSRAAGGEGHLEVAKNLYYSTHGLAHMVLSLKPFGCMPSTQSDAVQSAVTSHYPDMVFLPVETAGEGEINAHSRVQMALGDARTKAAAELEQALADSGMSLDDVRDYAADHPALTRASYRLPRSPGVAGTAANYVRHVAERSRATR